MIPLDTTIPEPALIVLIGAAGSGKSTWARTWAPTQVLELDHFRALVSDDAGDQDATADAVFALESVLEARLSRKLTTVLDATHTQQDVRAGLLKTAQRHGVPTVALLVATPASLCLSRNAERPENRRVPEMVLRAQHAAMVADHPGLHAEGFDHVVFSDNLLRLEVLLRRISNARRKELGLDGSDGLGDQLLLRRFFGPELAAMFTWKDGSQLAGGDRVGVISLGQNYLTLALRLDADGEGDIGFDVLLPCPASEGGTERKDEGCPGPAWAPVFNTTDLLKALTGEMDLDEDLVCTRCGPLSPADDQDDTFAEAV